MSTKVKTEYECDICPDGKESVENDTTEAFKWKEVRFQVDGLCFGHIDICPACTKKISSNKVVGRIAAIIKQAIESAAGGDK